MNAQELRIGNWIFDLTQSPTTVRGLTKYGIWISDNAGPGPEVAFTPIPLTEEWLLKFGFYMNNNAWEDCKDNNTDFSIWNPAKSDVYEMNSDPIMTRIEYVHQLQNIYFAVTGQELTIKQ